MSKLSPAYCTYSPSCENEVDADTDVCASHAETAAHVDAALDAEPHELPKHNDWTRHDDGSRSCEGYVVTKFGERSWVATAPDGTSVANTGDWTSSSRPFASLMSAISACRAHAAQR